MTTIAVIGVGILTWILISILVSLFLARINRLNRPNASPTELPPAPLVGKPAHSPSGEAMAWLPAQPTRFVGRAAAMAAASAALAPASGRTAVAFHGTAGVGKTTCAVELAYRHRRGFSALVFWPAPTDPERSGDALRLLALELEAQLGNHGFTMVDKIATEAHLKNFQPILSGVFADAGLLLVLDNLEALLTPDGQWRDPRWALLISALTCHRGASRTILTSRVLPSRAQRRRGIDSAGARPVPGRVPTSDRRAASFARVAGQCGVGPLPAHPDSR